MILRVILKTATWLPWFQGFFLVIPEEPWLARLGTEKLGHLWPGRGKLRKLAIGRSAPRAEVVAKPLQRREGGRVCLAWETALPPRYARTIGLLHLVPVHTQRCDFKRKKPRRKRPWRLAATTGP